MLSYRISGPADRELDEILRYVAEQAGMGAGLSLVSGLIDTFRLMAQYPQAGRAVEQFGEGVRRFPSGNYLIYYRIRRRWIEVLHVFHAARDQKKSWRKK